MVEKKLGEESFALTTEVQIALQLQIDVEGPETSENPTQSFIHNIIQRRIQVLAVILYIILKMPIYYVISPG